MRAAILKTSVAYVEDEEFEKKSRFMDSKRVIIWSHIIIESLN